MTVNIIGINAKQREGDGVINTTSRSSNWSVGLSPFIIGPIDLYKNAPCKQAIRFENLWQFSKCYWRYNSNGEPNSLYFDNFLIRAYNEINEQYNCISDEEYIIKKLLE